jgi:hypothetical protein
MCVAKFKFPGLLCVLPTLLFIAGCGAGASSSGSQQPPPPPTISLTVSPNPTSVRAGASATFSATVTGTQNTAVTWYVNDKAGGSTSLGTIDAAGKYTAPSVLPNPNSVTVKAVSSADSSKNGTSDVTLLNPTPVLTGISPASTNLGSFTLTVTGSSFVSGAQVMFGSTAFTTTFVSSAQLTATGTATSPGTYLITVENPDPGSSSSSAQGFTVNGSPQTSNCSQMSVGQGASLNGFVPFPSDNLWNKDISTANVDGNSANYINYIGSTVGLHPDFGSGEYDNSYMGIPYTVVNSSQSLIPVTYSPYGDESDPGPMPIPLTAPIEGYPNPGSGDRHVLVLDNSNCFLYELYSSYPQTASWDAGSGAVWDLLADEQRPYTWTSADAAGLPIFPGLVRYDEVAAGAINHAIRFTLQNSSAGFTPPASHWAATTSNANALPMGARLRLKQSFNISGFSTTNQVILNAMKKYGLILADNGSSMYISGTPDDRWNNDDLHNLGTVTAADFDVIQISPLYTSANVPSGPAPQISQFTACATSVSAGTPVTLSWQVTGASYIIVSPGDGATRGTSVSVTPTATTTYTLYATNAFGQTTASTTVTVQ